MCGGGPDLPPEKDPKAERLAAEREATIAANAKTADARRNKRSQSLLASGAQAAGQAQTSSVLAMGKDKLGS